MILCQRPQPIFDQPEEAVFDPEHLKPVEAGILYDGADDRIEPRAVAPGGEHSDAFHDEGWHHASEYVSDPCPSRDSFTARIRGSASRFAKLSKKDNAR